MRRGVSRMLGALFGARERRPYFAWVSTVVFAIVLIATHASHEGWRDELHCWSVGRNASGLWDLLLGNRRYDGHPFLWYYLIFLASRISRAVVALQALTISISVAAAYVWLRSSGAPRLVRLLLLPSYLFFYEYSVVCRSYILGALLLFCFVASYRREHVRYVRLSALLVLLALTSAYGALMSGALALFLFTRGVGVLRKDGSGKRRLLSTRRGYFPALGIYLLGAALTAATTLPPADGYWAPSWNLDQTKLQNAKNALQGFWWAFTPTNETWYSNNYLGSDKPFGQEHVAWFGLGLLLLWILALRRSPILALTFTFGAVAMGVFGQVKYAGGLRHVGNVMLLLLACGGLARREVPATRSFSLLWVLLAGCLCVQIRSNVASTKADWERPFSGTLAAARFIERTYPRDTLIIGSNDSVASGVASHLDRGILFAETGDFGQSVVSHNRRWGVTQDSILSTAKQSLTGQARVLLVLNFPLYRTDPTLRVALRLLTEPPIVPDERLWIYEVSPLEGAS